jgi:hypothetical protein
MSNSANFHNNLPQRTPWTPVWNFRKSDSFWYYVTGRQTQTDRYGLHIRCSFPYFVKRVPKNHHRHLDRGPIGTHVGTCNLQRIPWTLPHGLLHIMVWCEGTSFEAPLLLPKHENCVTISLRFMHNIWELPIAWPSVGPVIYGPREGRHCHAGGWCQQWF